jgi:hypothetical protein
MKVTNRKLQNANASRIANGPRRTQLVVQFAAYVSVFLWLSSAVLLTGCSEPEVVPSEPKRADDALTSTELESFLSIVESLPDNKLPPLPSVILAAPQWNRNRSLPIYELVKEEETSRVDRWSIDWLAAHCPQSRFLKRALRREKMTLEQFVGLYLALGTALYRDSVPADRELEPILDRGKKAIAELKKDHRIFSTLPEDQAYFLQEQSGWVAVVDRARRVKPVHPANLALVRQHHERLALAMPAEFLRNPFLEFTTILDERGVPFQEPLGEERDDHIVWSRDQALIGDASPEQDTP